VFEYHHDLVTAIPGGATILAKNNLGIQAFCYNNFYAIQFHPEINAKTASMMFDRDEKPLNLDLSGLDGDYDVPQLIINNFVNLDRNILI